ncbi:MAG: hypothetical protein IJ580_04280 [Prevotella sp.]|nr:hypothetical protein [Prevotella sp.]
MKKRFLNALLIGAMFVTSVGVASCGYDDDDLQSRITVVEGSLSEINSQLAALQAKGLGILKADQAADGTWSLTLSDNRIVTIKAAGGEVTVTETASAFIIKVGDNEYVLPKGAAAAQLIYSPQYEDGIEVYDGKAIGVKFMMSPKLTSLDGASFDIQEAHELKTRAGSSLFKIADGASIDGDFITIPIQATEAEEGKTYAASVLVSQDGKDYISNYFTIKVVSNSFVAEDLQDYSFAASVVDAKKDDESGLWTATLPADLADDFDFSALFTDVPAGAKYEVASASKQIGNAANNEVRKILANSLAVNGKWSLSGRPGCAFPDGFVVNITIDGVVKMKVNWIFNDPLANVDFKSSIEHLSTHMEICPEDGSGFWAPGVNAGFDIPKAFSAVFNGDDSAVPLQHGDANGFLHNEWGKYSVTLKEEGDVLYNDGTYVVMGDAGKKYAKHSKGFYWFLGGAAVTSSNRRNIADKPESEAELIAKFGGNCNGEIIGGWDWIPYEDWHDLIGIDINAAGLMFTGAQYPGWGLRIHARATYEYDFGSRNFGDGDGGVAFLFINRRGAGEGVIDPAAR